MVKVSGKALAAGKIEANVSGAIPAASALPLTIFVSSPSQATSRLSKIHVPTMNARFLQTFE